MDKNYAVGAVEIAGGGYLGDLGVKHGLPRTLGLRTEYHTTDLTNANNIKKIGNYLDPACSGNNGWAERIGGTPYIKNSQNYVHITGVHKNSHAAYIFAKSDNILKKNMIAPFRTTYRTYQCLVYRMADNNIDMRKVRRSLKTSSLKENIKTLGNLAHTYMFPNNPTKRFCISAPDSYFNNNFIPDTDDIALKTTKKLKVYDTRLEAMAAGLKNFGLKGMKENKGRVMFGAGVLASGLYGAYKLITSGLNNFSKSFNYS